MKTHFFRSADEFRKWLSLNHATASELWVGFYRKAASKTGISYSDAVDQALCFGWIDGIRKGVDEDSYKMRFTPRKRGSIWSAVNIDKAGALIKEGLMEPSGRAAFEARDEKRSKVYSYEQENPALTAAQEKLLRSNKKAWTFFQEQAPWYRRTATWWVISAKRSETRERRLAKLIEDSAAGRRLAHLSRTPASNSSRRR